MLSRGDRGIAFRWLVVVGANLCASIGCAKAPDAVVDVVRVARGVQRPTREPPRLLYTDIVSGPNTGGENNKGIYLSLFGKNFGETGLGTAIKVYINNVEVDTYLSIGPSRARADIQQIVVQIGPLENPVPGNPMPIKVVVNALESNQDLMFTVNPGRILFVDNAHGNDRTGLPGDIRRPFRYVQTNLLDKPPTSGAWGLVQPGDFIVMRRGTGEWIDLGYFNYFIRLQEKSGNSPTGKLGTGPIGLMGYPGEDVFINNAFDPVHNKRDPTTNPPTTGTVTGAIASSDSFGRGKFSAGKWITISNLRVEGGNNDGAINVGVGADSWRIINNELTAASSSKYVYRDGSGAAKAGGIAGNGFSQVWYGNYIHDIYCGPEGKGPFQNHGIYIDGDGSYDIAYNRIEKIPGGNGFQTYVNGANGSDETNNIQLHHNLISGAGKHGINVGDNTRNNLRIWNNVISNSSLAGIRLRSDILTDAKIYNNTFFGNNRLRNENYGAITLDPGLPKNAIDVQNNIFAIPAGTKYLGGAGSVFSVKAGIKEALSGSFPSHVPGSFRNNLWYGGGSIGFDQHPVFGIVGFVVPGTDFHLAPGSAAINAGSTGVSEVVRDDFDATKHRPQGAKYDIGAFEFR